jgi:hypothetical protein
MRNIRKVYNVVFTSGVGDDAVNCSEIYESSGNAAGRMNVLMNNEVDADCHDAYEVGANLGVFAGTLVGSLASAERLAEHNYGEAVL